jgi:polysaccharide export outer membrane protein
MATKFELRSKDVLFVSNAPAVEMNKAMVFFQTVVGTVNDPITSAINVYALKAAIKNPTTATTIVGGATVQ